MNPFASPRQLRRALIGLVLLASSQYLMLRSEMIPYNPLGIFNKGLQFTYHFDIANPDNVLVALVLLTIGSIFLWRSLPVPVDASASTATPRKQIGWLPPDSWWLLGSAGLLWVYVLYMLHANAYSQPLLLLWLWAMVLLVLISVRSDKQRAIRLQINLDVGDYFWMLALCVLGLAIASYKLQVVPAVFIGDEWGFWMNARDIARGTYHPVPLGFGVYSYPVLSSIYQSLVIKLFGETLWSWRFASVLASVAAVVPTYLLARAMFNRLLAFISATLLIVMPYSLSFARLGYNNSQAIAPVVASLYLIYIAVERESVFYTLMAGFVAGYGFYTYTAGRLGFVVAILFLGSCILAQMKWSLRDIDRTHFVKTVRRISLLMTVFVVGWLVVVLPHIVYGSVADPSGLSHKLLESVFSNVFYGRSLYYDDQLFRDAPPVLIGDQQFFFRPDLYVQLLVRGLVRTFLVFHHPSVDQVYFIVGPLPGAVLVIPAWCGFLLALHHHKIASYRLLVIWSLAGSVLLSVLDTFPPRQAHLIVLTPVLALYSALGITWCADIGAAWLVRWRRHVQRAIVFGCVLVAIGAGLHAYFVEMPQRYRPSPEDIMNSYALGLQRPEQIIYATNDKQKQGFVPIAVREMTTTARYQTMVLNPGRPEAIVVDHSLPLTVFTNPQDVIVTTRWLQREFGRTFQPQPMPAQGLPVLLVYIIRPAAR